MNISIGVWFLRVSILFFSIYESILHSISTYITPLRIVLRLFTFFKARLLAPVIIFLYRKTHVEALTDVIYILTRQDNQQNSLHDSQQSTTKIQTRVKVIQRTSSTAYHPTHYQQIGHNVNVVFTSPVGNRHHNNGEITCTAL
eukprot:TRINITY_DN6223_c0_g1_i4.p1 TRINITY_DN6223_c0_g1~~TRINITY_DN6223_c0_g1_i4.p1  ORF type:complete len:143 (-),score=1.66 TRINITY_DN6223_c0_g1_i4:172-600(-)